MELLITIVLLVITLGLFLVLLLALLDGSW